MSKNKVKAARYSLIVRYKVTDMRNSCKCL